MSETPTRSAMDAAVGQLRAITSHILNPTWLASLTLLGFVFSVGTNSLIFLAWGLPFTQFATVGDVLMSGVQALVIGAIVASGVSFGVLLVPIFRAEQRPRWLRPEVAALTVMAIILSLIAVSNQFSENYLQAPIILSVMFLAPSGIIFFASMKVRSHQWLIYGIGALSVLAIIIMIIQVSIGAIVTGGYARGAETTSISECAKATIFWLGEDSAVVQCPDGTIVGVRNVGPIVVLPYEPVDPALRPYPSPKPAQPLPPAAAGKAAQRPPPRPAAKVESQLAQK